MVLVLRQRRPREIPRRFQVMNKDGVGKIIEVGRRELNFNKEICVTSYERAWTSSMPSKTNVVMSVRESEVLAT